MTLFIILLFCFVSKNSFFILTETSVDPLKIIYYCFENSFVTLFHLFHDL
jgi:hypothetical protein